MNCSNDGLEVETEINNAMPWPLKLTSRHGCWTSKVRAVGILRKCILELKDLVAGKKNNEPKTRLRPRKNDGNEKKSRIILSQEEKQEAESLKISAIQIGVSSHHLHCRQSRQKFCISDSLCAQKTQIYEHNGRT